MKLYEISDAIEVILANEVDQETGEIDERTYKNLDMLEQDKKDVILHIGRYIKGERAEAAAIKVEASKLMDRARVHDNRAKSLSFYIGMHLGDGVVIEDGTVKVDWGKSSAVQVLAVPGTTEEPTGDDLKAFVDPKYVRTKTEITISVDRASALPVLRAGNKIEGLKLDKRTKVRIA